MSDEKENLSLEEMWNTFIGNAFQMEDIDCVSVMASNKQGRLHTYAHGDFLKLFGMITMEQDKLSYRGLSQSMQPNNTDSDDE